MPTITQLSLFPIKSCAGIRVNQAILRSTGLEVDGVGDREWMVVDQHDVLLSQREHPRMALIKPQIGGTHLDIIAEGQPLLQLPLKSALTQAHRRVIIWEEAVDALDMGDEAANWFSSFLGLPCRLVRFQAGVQRLSSETWTKGEAAPNLFSDGFPILVVSEASLQDLNAKSISKGGKAFTMNRFRPNVVVDGIEAFEEDYCETMNVDDGVRQISFKLVKPCARCPMPSVDPERGVFSENPLDILQTYRANPLVDGGITFGMNAIVSVGDGQLLRVGDVLDMPIAFD